MQSEEIETTAPPEVDDATLVERMAEGDETALGGLYDRFAGMLLGLARRVLHSTSDAEEVVQEVFLQVWRQAGRYDRTKSSVSTWLVLITRSRSIDRLRSRQVKDRTLDQVQQEKPQLHTSPEGHGIRTTGAETSSGCVRETAGAAAGAAAGSGAGLLRGMTQSEIAAPPAFPSAPSRPARCWR